MDNFNQALSSGTLLEGLIDLTITDFNQSLVPGALPAGLVHLELGQVFRQPLDTGMLPSPWRASC